MVREVLARCSELSRLRLLSLAWAVSVLVLAMVFSAALEASLGRAFFDRLQRLFPRQALSQPVTIVAIDEKSLAEIGQWPWPRARTAALVAAVNAQQPLAVGLDILFAEADRYSGPRLLAALPGLSPEAARDVAAQASGDSLLAQAMVSGNVVLGRAGIDAGGPAGSDIVKLDPPPVGSLIDAQAPVSMPRFSGLLPSVPELSAAASGHGLVSNQFADGVVRTMPLLAGVGAVGLMPGLALAMLQQATRQPGITLQNDRYGLRRVQLESLSIPVNADGSFNLHFAPRDGARLISAADLLAGRVAPDALKERFVLVGFTALALMDVVATPIGERMPGVETHAQLLETLLDQHWLERPPWLRAAEWATLALAGLALALLVPSLRPAASVALWSGLGAAMLMLGVLAFRQHYLVDAASVVGGLSLIYGGVLALTLHAADSQRRRLAAALQLERNAAARLEGELAAASRVQMGMLPSAAEWPQDPRIELAASMIPARRVGGDLYDLISIDQRLLCFLIGDVSGKGLPASVFMALSKALMKSLALRGQESAAALLAAANREVARDNPEALFVTALAGYLDLDSGRLDLASAGHEAPTLLGGGGQPRQLQLLSGPPLCVIDDYPYQSVSLDFRPGEVLVLSTDGIQEAQNGAGELYGRQRFSSCLARCPGDLPVEQILRQVEQDVVRFVAGAEAADDATLLILRWRGPAQ